MVFRFEIDLELFQLSELQLIKNSRIVHRLIFDIFLIIITNSFKTKI
jgi:hypothetical protein